MAGGGLDLLEGSLGHDAAAGPDEAELELAVHLHSQDRADEFGWPVIIGTVTFVAGAALERRIGGEDQFLNIPQVPQMFPTFWSLGLVQKDLQYRFFVE